MSDATQQTKDQCATPRTDAAEAVRENGGDLTDVFTAMRQLERELTEALRSLRREENAREVLADDNTRLRARLREAARDAREDARDAAAEERWKEQQGVDYGTY